MHDDNAINACYFTRVVKQALAEEGDCTKGAFTIFHLHEMLRPSQTPLFE